METELLNAACTAWGGSELLVTGGYPRKFVDRHTGKESLALVSAPQPPTPLSLIIIMLKII